MNNIQKLVKYFKKSLIINSILVFSVWVLSCDNHSIFKSYVDLKDSNWYVKNIPSFTFEVKDEKVPYNIYLLIRNSSQYPYNNLYINRYIYGPDGKQISNRLEEATLFNSKTGKPFGKGLGDIFDQKLLSTRNYIFPKKGKYTIKLKQYMRQDPLPHLMSVGISVEKILTLKQ